MRNEDDRGEQPAESPDATTCPNCGALMPAELRFCRACGSRMGEGVEEDKETERFEGGRSTARGGRTKTAEAGAPPANSKEFRAHDQTVKSLTGGLGPVGRVSRACRRMPRWIVWVLVPLFVIGLTNGLFSPSTTRLRNRNKNRDEASASAPHSFLGSNYKTDERGGAFLEVVSPPGSAADKAGLVGGDLITGFDGKPVKTEDELTNLLTSTPPGKTVEVTYVRDGETRTAKLTTVSEEENSRLEEAFRGRSEGQARMGFDDDEAEAVAVPGTKIYGVRLDDIERNLPADMAGVRAGDVVIQLDETPIRTVRELVMRIRRAVPYSTVKLVVMRGAERLEIPVKVGKL